MKHIKNLGWSTQLPKKLKTAPDWLEIIPFGIHSRPPKGIQKFTQLEANEVTRNFNSLSSKIARGFKPLPVITQSKVLCGSISQLEIRNSALWAFISWNDTGKNTLSQHLTHFFTPLWISSAEYWDVFTPCKLLEIQLSQRPYAIITPPKPKPKKLPLRTKSITSNLQGKTSPLNDPRQQFLQLVDEHMQKTGDPYLISWSIVKHKHPTLFQNF